MWIDVCDDRHVLYKRSRARVMSFVVVISVQRTPELGSTSKLLAAGLLTSWRFVGNSLVAS